MKLGWMQVLVPDDFDRMGDDEIVMQFEGDVATGGSAATTPVD